MITVTNNSLLQINAALFSMKEDINLLKSSTSSDNAKLKELLTNFTNNFEQATFDITYPIGSAIITDEDNSPEALFPNVKATWENKYSITADTTDNTSAVLHVWKRIE
jgi:hypothetical protein